MPKVMTTDRASVAAAIVGEVIVAARERVRMHERVCGRENKEEVGRSE